MGDRIRRFTAAIARMTKPISSALILDTKLGNINSYLTSLVAEGFQAVLGERVVVSDYHRCIRDAEQFRPDLVLCFDGQEANDLMIAKLRKLAPRMVLWLTEDPYERTANAKRIAPFDLVFTNDAGSVSFYRDPRVRHLPLAASPFLHDLPVLEDESSYLYDVFFAGVAWPNRVRFLRELRPLVADLRVRMVLPHNEALRPPNVGAPAFEVDQRICNRDIAFLQNRSRIVLYLDRDFSASGNHPRSATPGPRLFETALSGAFQLAHGIAPGVSDYFTPGRDVAVFSDSGDCARKIRHYLAAANERRSMAVAAQTRARRDHLYEHRAREIVRALGELPLAPRPAVQPKRPTTVLYVAHNSVGRQPFGGTELHLTHVRRTLPHRFRSLAYYPDHAVAGATRLVLSRTGRDGSPVDKFVTIDAPFDPLAVSDPEREQAFARILEQEQIDVVHFLHLMNHPPSLIEVARRHGARTVVTLPDYFVVCPRFTLLDAENQFCWKGMPPLASCDIDLKRADRIEFGSQARRRAAYASFLGLADVLTCLSGSQAEILREAYPHLDSRIEVIPWGIDRVPFDEILDRRPLPGARLTVAAIGNFTRAKGAEQLIYLLNYFRDDLRVRFLILGRVDAPYDDILRQLDIPNLQVVGAYEAADLPRILGHVDVGLFGSVWAETFVLALSEAWAAGVVPIATDIGALGERVKNEVNGLKVPAASPGHLAHALERLLRDRALLNRLREGVLNTPIPTVEQSTDRYVKVYDRLLEERGDVRADVTPDQARSFHVIPSSVVRVANRWGWTGDAMPHVPVKALASKRREANGPMLSARLSAWTGEALAATIEVDPPNIHGDEMLNGSVKGPAWLVETGRVRAVKIFGTDAAFSNWHAVGCVAEDEAAGFSDWFLTEGSDPQLISQALDFDWGDFDGILVSMAAQAEEGLAGGQVFFSGAHSQAFSERLSLRFVVNCDGCVHRYMIRPHRSETLRVFSSIQRLRFDPLDVRGSFYVEKIVLFADRPRLRAAAFMGAPGRNPSGGD